MATHFSILAWRIPWTEEPGALQSMGSQSQTALSDRAHMPHYWCPDHSKSVEMCSYRLSRSMHSLGDYYLKARLAFLSRTEGNIVGHNQ